MCVCSHIICTYICIKAVKCDCDKIYKANSGEPQPSVTYAVFLSSALPAILYSYFAKTELEQSLSCCNGIFSIGRGLMGIKNNHYMLLSTCMFANLRPQEGLTGSEEP